MTADPAIAAAQRYWQSVDPHWTGNEDDMGFAIASGAAREALAPIRDLHQPAREGAWLVCAHCSAGASLVRWPCDTAELAYTDHELGDDDQ